MGVDLVVIYSTSNRPEKEGVVTKYTMSGQSMGFIIKEEMDWRRFYNYINSVARITEITSEELDKRLEE